MATLVVFRVLFFTRPPSLDDILVDGAERTDVAVADDESEDDDDCEPKLLRLSSLLSYINSCNVLLLSLEGGLCLGLDKDDTLATLLPILHILLLLFVR